MNTKTLPNTAAIQNLKNQGFRVTINHFRKWKGLRGIVRDKEVRSFVNRFNSENWWQAIDQKGGATDLILERGEEKITVRATCYHKDHFCRRTGVLECLKKLENLHNIKA